MLMCVSCRHTLYLSVHNDSSLIVVSFLGCRCIFVCTNLHLDVFRTGTGGYNRWTGDSSVAQVLAQRADVSYLSGHVEEHNDNQRMSAPLLR